MLFTTRNPDESFISNLKLPESQMIFDASKALCVGPQTPKTMHRLGSSYFTSKKGAGHAMLPQFHQLLLRVPCSG